MSELWNDFVASWPLFGTSYATGWLIAALLALVGVIVIAQRQIFVGVAIAQASSFGIALALAVGAASATLDDHHALHGMPLFAGTASAILAAVLTARPGRSLEQADATAAFVFLVASSGAVVLLADHPNGLEEVERMMFSTLIGADVHDLWKFSALLAAAIVALALTHRAVLLATTDPTTATALGVRVGAIELAIAVATGTAVGTAMHSAGTLYTFGCLVLPALTSKHICRTMRPMLVVAPLIGVGTAFVGFVWANHADLPPGQATVVVQGAALAVAWGIRRARMR